MPRIVTPDQIQKTLAHYVAMPTVSENIIACSAAMKSLALEFTKLGMHTHLDGPVHPWLIATSTAQALDNKKTKVLFVIHFDTVPFENEGQLSLRAAGDKLYGRGAYDMKFAAAACKEMVEDFAEAKQLTEYDFGILFTTDEEKGGYDGAKHFLQQGWRCDIAVVPDGGYDWTIESRTKGLNYIYLVAHGRSAHSSRPWLGDNPIAKLAPAIAKITAEFVETNANPHTAAVSINSLETSNTGTVNGTQIPAWAKAGISIRAFTAAETAEALAKITEIAHTYGVALQSTIADAPMQVNATHPLVASFIEVASGIKGEPVGFTDALAASDARHFDKMGIPTVLLYPHGGDHHGPNEWVSKKDLHAYYRLCKTYVQREARMHIDASGV